MEDNFNPFSRLARTLLIILHGLGAFVVLKLGLVDCSHLSELWIV